MLEKLFLKLNPLAKICFTYFFPCAYLVATKKVNRGGLDKSVAR